MQKCTDRATVPASLAGRPHSGQEIGPSVVFVQVPHTPEAAEAGLGADCGISSGGHS